MIGQEFFWNKFWEHGLGRIQKPLHLCPTAKPENLWHNWGAFYSSVLLIVLNIVLCIMSVFVHNGVWSKDIKFRPLDGWSKNHSRGTEKNPCPSNSFAQI